MGMRTDVWSQGGQVACGLAKSRHWQVRFSLGSPFLSEGRLLAVACPTLGGEEALWAGHGSLINWISKLRT